MSKTWLPKLGGPGNVNIDVHVTTTLKRSQEKECSYETFGGHSLNVFDVIKLFSGGGGGGGRVEVASIAPRFEEA